MAEDNQQASTERFKRSCIYAIVAVVASTLAVLVLVSIGGTRTASGSAMSGLDISAYIFGLPLVAGWLIVRGIFGEWSVIHGAQIFWVWPLSVAIDSLVIFLVWEFLHRKASHDLASNSTLGLD